MSNHLPENPKNRPLQIILNAKRIKILIPSRARERRGGVSMGMLGDEIRLSIGLFARERFRILAKIACHFLYIFYTQSAERIVVTPLGRRFFGVTRRLCRNRDNSINSSRAYEGDHVPSWID